MIRTDFIRRAEMARRLGISLRCLDLWSTRGLRGAVLRRHWNGGRVEYLEEDVLAWQMEVNRRRAARPRKRRTRGEVERVKSRDRRLERTFGGVAKWEG